MIYEHYKYQLPIATNNDLGFYLTPHWLIMWTHRSSYQGLDIKILNLQHLEKLRILGSYID